MKSVKPGRGPSFLSGVGGIVAGVFGVIWTIMAGSIGAPWFFTAFGVVFILLAIGGAVYNFINATNKKRFSAFDITSDDEEPDPLNQVFGEDSDTAGARAGGEASDPLSQAFGEGRTAAGSKSEARFCPYCGAKAEADYRFCAGCGKQLP